MAPEHDCAAIAAEHFAMSDPVRQELWRQRMVEDWRDAEIRLRVGRTQRATTNARWN